MKSLPALALDSVLRIHRHRWDSALLLYINWSPLLAADPKMILVLISFWEAPRWLIQLGTYEPLKTCWATVGCTVTQRATGCLACPRSLLLKHYGMDFFTWYPDSFLDNYWVNNNVGHASSCSRARGVIHPQYADVEVFPSIFDFAVCKSNSYFVWLFKMQSMCIY